MKIIKSMSLVFLFFFITSCGKLFDSKKPEVKILSPIEGQELFGKVEIKVEAKDNKGIEKIEIYVNNDIKTIIKSSTGTYVWDFSSTDAEKEYIIKARAYDKAGNYGEASIKFKGKSILLLGPELVVPLQESSFSNLVQKFEWKKVNNGVEYNIQIDDIEDFYTPLLNINTQETSVSYSFEKYATYFWRVRVKDNNGLWSYWSKYCKFTIAIPVVEFEKPEYVSRYSFKLKWGKYNGIQFASYKIYRSSKTGVNINADLIAEIKSVDIISCIDKVLTFDRNYYKIYVTLTTGQVIESKETSVIIQLPDNAIENLRASVNDATSVTLKWNKYEGTFFVSYKIYRSTTKNVNINSATLLKEENDVTKVEYIDSNLTPGQEYFYKIYIFIDNNSSHYADTNEVNVIPKPVLAATSNDATSVTLKWEKYIGTTFASYKIYRSNTKNVTTASTLVKEETDINKVEYTDTGLTTKTKYFYKVYYYIIPTNFIETNEVEVTTK